MYTPSFDLPFVITDSLGGLYTQMCNSSFNGWNFSSFLQVLHPGTCSFQLIAIPGISDPRTNTESSSLLTSWPTSNHYGNSIPWFSVKLEYPLNRPLQPHLYLLVMCFSRSSQSHINTEMPSWPSHGLGSLVSPTLFMLKGPCPALNLSGITHALPLFWGALLFFPCYASSISVYYAKYIILSFFPPRTHSLLTPLLSQILLSHLHAKVIITHTPFIPSLFSHNWSSSKRAFQAQLCWSCSLSHPEGFCRWRDTCLLPGLVPGRTCVF